jgi:hypothetical protein
MSTALATSQLVDETTRKIHQGWIARAGLAGIELRRLDSGQWLAHRWNLHRELDESQVEAWLGRIGAPA